MDWQYQLAQVDVLPAVDRWGFAGMGIALVAYVVWLNKQFLDKIAPTLERTAQTLTSNALVMERVVRLLDKVEERHSR